MVSTIIEYFFVRDRVAVSVNPIQDNLAQVTLPEDKDFLEEVSQNIEIDLKRSDLFKELLI